MKTIFLSLSILISAICYAGTAEEIYKKNSLLIDPTLRAADYLQAYETLKKEKPSNKVYISLVSGKSITNIIEMQKMASSTLFLVRYNTPQGLKLQVVELEAILGLGYLE